MLKIKLSINESGVYLNGLFIDGNGNKCSINKECCDELHALETVQLMRERDCEFSLIVMRKV